MEEVRKIYNPEFLNRLDETIVFRSLTRDHMELIIQILLEQVRARLLDTGMDVSLTHGAAELLLDKGFDPDLGARPMRRAIQRYIEDPLAEQVLKGKFKSGDVIRVTKRGEELGFETVKSGETTRAGAEPPASAPDTQEAQGAPGASEEDSLLSGQGS
jgi:ATP-dependent Clp protease ATP-binding subunit ClpC